MFSCSRQAIVNVNGTAAIEPTRYQAPLQHCTTAIRIDLSSSSSLFHVGLLLSVLLFGCLLEPLLDNTGPILSVCRIHLNRGYAVTVSFVDIVGARREMGRANPSRTKTINPINQLK